MNASATFKSGIIAGLSKPTQFEKIQKGQGVLMSEKSTDEELEQNIKALGKDAGKYQGAEADLMKFIMDSSPDAICFKDLQSHYIVVNDKTLEAFGLSREEVMGKNDAELMTNPKEAEDSIEDDRIVFKSGKKKKVIKPITGADGKEAWIQVFKFPKFDTNNKVTGLACFSRNVTEQMRVQRIQVAQLRLVKYAADHTVLEFLQKFLDEAEALTESKIGFYHFLEDDQKTLSLQTWSTNTLVNMCMASGTGLHYPVSEAGVWVDCIRQRKPVVHNDYKSLPHKKGLPEGHAPVIRELVVPVFRGKKIVAILGVGNKPTDYDAHDVNAIQQLADLAWETVTHKQAEEKIRRLNETLEQRIAKRTAELENRTELLQRLALELSGAEDRERRQIASILHDDFQQHLAYIKMELGLVCKTVDKEVGQRLDLLARLTGECIDKSRNLSYELNPPALHRSGLLAAINVLAKDMERRQGLAVTVRTHPNAEPTSPSLAMILYRSVRELLLNVVKHAGVDSAVVDLRSKNELICLRVEDRGNGFDFNAVKANQSSDAGFGLYNIEDRMTSLGGSMEVRTDPGKGCCVVLTVPKGVPRKPAVTEAALDASAQELVRNVPAEPIHPIVGKKQIRVLLADDHKLIREALANLLKRRKELAIVGQALNGCEAVELAAKLKPHVILMDVTMPVLNGFEATAQITSDFPNIRIIGLSMHNDEDTRQKMLDAGASAYLSKTESPDTLIRSILHVYRGDEVLN